MGDSMEKRALKELKPVVKSTASSMDTIDVAMDNNQISMFFLLVVLSASTMIEIYSGYGELLKFIRIYFRGNEKTSFKVILYFHQRN
jgi:hypothetical protein